MSDDQIISDNDFDLRSELTDLQLLSSPDRRSLATSTTPTGSKPQDDSFSNPESPSSIQAVHSLSSVPLHATLSQPTPLEQLINASQRGDVLTLEYLLNNSSSNIQPLSPNSTGPDGVTPLHWAALNNKLSAVKYLVSKGADPNIKGGELGATPLLWAVRYGLVYVADWLVKEAGADITVKDSTGIGCLLSAVFSSNIMMVIYMLWAMDEKDEQNGHECIIGSNGVDTIDLKKRTALHWAAYQGDFLTVEILLNAKAKLDLVDESGFTPLHWGLVRGSKAVVELLIKNGANPTALTSDGKSCWDISNDMSCLEMWESVLQENDLDINTGERLKKIMKEEWAKVITFFLPYISLPLSIGIIAGNSPWLMKILWLTLLILGQQVFLKKVILPVYVTGRNAFLKSAFFSGLFSSTAVWCTITWLAFLLPHTLTENSLNNLLFLLLTTGVLYFFFKAMFTDPGYIHEDDDPNSIKQTIYELITIRKFDSINFCIHSLIRKPLRSKYSKIKSLNIARFDHYCPWINNDVGVRNHKLFFAFIVFLELAVMVWIQLSMEFFDELDLSDGIKKSCPILNQNLCSGYQGSSFIFIFFLWVCAQFCWLSILLIVQIFQISKGVTTYELSNLYHNENRSSFSSIPNDEPLDETRTEDVLSLDRTIQSSSGPISTLLGFVSFILSLRVSKMIGLDQFALMTDNLIQRRRNNRSNLVNKSQFDFGFVRNWLDFLFLKRQGDNYCFRTLLALPTGCEGNLNNCLVDYCKLFNLPDDV